jgi:uncharacterized protein YkwD
MRSLPALAALVALLALLAAGCGGGTTSADSAAGVDFSAAAAGAGPPGSVNEPEQVLPKLASVLDKATTTSSTTPTTSITTTTRPAATTSGPPARQSQTTTTRKPPSRSGGSGGAGGGSSASATEREVLTLVNQERARAGCGPLREDARLTTAAGLHSQDMLENDYFSHDSPTQGSPSDRAARQGYPSGVGENIAAGYPTPQAVVDGWMESRGHRENILDCGYKSTGVGFVSGSTGYRTYWTQMFGNV